VLSAIDLGSGDPVVIMQGFALQPRTYRAVADLLAERCRVIIPPLFAESGWHWSPDRVLDDLEATLDHLGVGAVTMIGHSFGGALELNFAVRHPERITELVFADTLAMAHEWSLAAEAVRPASLVWMATPRAAIDFTTSFLSHPLCLAQAGWWGFRSDRRDQVATIAASGIPCHVLWADRDSLLSRSDGTAFARDLGADFTVVHGPSRHPVDHDWVYRHPHLVMKHLDRLGLQALAGPSKPPDARSRRAAAR
jgi:pimeloyl-ACP methyl ester carboxylesterase